MIILGDALLMVFDLSTNEDTITMLVRNQTIFRVVGYPQDLRAGHLGSICTPRVLSIGHQTWVVTGKRQQSEENVGTCDRSVVFNPWRQIPDIFSYFVCSL